MHNKYVFTYCYGAVVARTTSNEEKPPTPSHGGNMILESTKDN